MDEDFLMGVRWTLFGKDRSAGGKILLINFPELVRLIIGDILFIYINIYKYIYIYQPNKEILVLNKISIVENWLIIHV